MHDACRKTLWELAGSIEAGELSSSEAVTASLERAREVDPVINALVETTEDPVAGSSRDGVLRGAPIVVKDQLVDRDRVPTCGSRVGAEWLRGTASALTRLRDAGGSIVGYANMHEWGVGTTSVISAFGPVANPWDSTRVAGGSSGGSAAAVAAGVVPVAIGTDAGGSVRIPAACCRITGFKPTHGLVPTDGFVGDGHSIDHIGVLARSVRDVRLVAEVLAGRPLREGLASRMKVGVVRDFFDDVQAELRAPLLFGLELLAAAWPCLDVTVADPRLTREAVRGSLLPFIALSGGGAVVRRAAELQPPTGRLVMRGDAMSAADLDAARHAHDEVRRAWFEALESVDLLVTPTIAALPPPIADPVVDLPSGRAHFDLTNVALNGPMNLAGLPALSLPCGKTAGGWTANITITGRAGDDARVLAAGEWIEEITSFRHVNAVADLEGH